MFKTLVEDIAGIIVLKLQCITML